ncbi:DeoR/GlpR family DNA-binding transcription regulator [Clostridium akagii]|uniref:DeoR/GlpR family DNA-binding transcription regulator n=1 Tax=Clostridium akagii TaxID=91623 RepID=UPI00047B8A9C|nr:DeoR/GlpR family DNA-binding transcription regulator [Clostridium akagii]
MLKKERLLSLLEMTNKEGFLAVSKASEALKVSEMTVRRDLAELEKSGRLIRLHGGSQSLNHNKREELSRSEKMDIHVEEKNEVAQIVASLIEEGDTIFLGPGTTIEMVPDYINLDFIRVVTNSLPVFEKLQENCSQYEILLIGGNYRKHSGAFIGNIANETLEKLRVTKAFISVNGVLNEKVSNANSEEGRTQSIALNHANEKYIIADHYKLNTEDFYCFYSLNDVDAMVIDKGIDDEMVRHYEQFTKIITNKKRGE